MTIEGPLTHDEHKAAEAAFRGLPLNPRWSRNAQEMYLGIVKVTKGRDIVAGADADAEREADVVVA